MSPSIIACRPWSYHPFMQLAYEHMAGLGIRHVEIMVPKPAELDGVKAELGRWGLSASSLHSECDVTRADIAKLIAEQMPAFKALGTKYMFVSVKAGEVPLDTVYGRLREAGEVAKAFGVTIVMETHPDLITNAAVALATMRGVNHPNVRVNYDTANIYYYNQGVDGVAELQRVVEYVASLHLKETDGTFHGWSFPALGRGVVRFRETFEVLDKAGFKGPCTLEIEGVEGETKTERLVCDRIAESVGFLRGLGRL
jgi:sugar phosphate isomerase/epimerase